MTAEYCGGNANALRGTETLDAIPDKRIAVRVAETPMPYGALKLRTVALMSAADSLVAETPMPYGALKLVFAHFAPSITHCGGNANALRGTETIMSPAITRGASMGGGNANALRGTETLFV